MNFITRTVVLSLFLLLSSAGYSLNAMELHHTTAGISKEELILGMRTLPHKLKQYVIYLILQNSLFDFQLYKTFNLESTPASLALSPDGENLLIGYYSKKDAQLFNIHTGNEVRAFSGETNFITSVAVSAQGERCLTGHFYKTACVWNSSTGELLTTFTGHTRHVSSVAFSQTGERCLTGSGDNTACVWNSKTGELLTTFNGHTGCVSSVAFSPNGEACLTGSHDKTVCVWSATTGELFKTFSGYPAPIISVAWGSNGQTCIGGSEDGTFYIWNWNSQTGQRVNLSKDENTVFTEAAFSPTGKMCLIGSNDGRAYFCNFKTGELVTSFKGHTDYIRSVALSPDGQLCFTLSNDRTMCVWEGVYGLTSLTPDKRNKAFTHFIPFYPLLIRQISDRPGEGENNANSSSESLVIKGIGTGLDINSGGQKNCIIS